MADRDSKSPGGVPARRIDRAALERIIQRATELQAGDLETGDSLTEQELLKLGADVGIDGRFLRQALYEQSAGSTPDEAGFLVRWFGPNRVSAGRVVPGEKEAIEAALAHWMTEGEALAVKRRLPDRTVWEKQRGFFAEMKRGFGVGGKSYHLARALDVTVVVTPLEAGYCHVELIADVSKKRAGMIGGGAAGATALAIVGAGMFPLLAHATPFLVTLIAAVPLTGAAIVPGAVGRAQRRNSDRMQLALEQVLDRLEHGEIKPRHRDADLGDLLLTKVASEVRRAIGEATQRPRRQLPPTDPKP